MNAFDLAASPTQTDTVEHPVATVVRLRAMRRTLWAQHVWANQSGSAQPVAIHPDEVYRILADPGVLADHESAFYRENDEAAALTAAVDVASAALATDERWQLLLARFELTDAEEQLLSLAIALAVEPALGRVFAYLHDQLEMQYPTAWLASALYGPDTRAVPLSGHSALLRWRLVSRAPDPPAVQGLVAGWLADPLIVGWLLGSGNQGLPRGARLEAANEFLTLPRIYEAEARAAAEFLAIADGARSEVELIGAEGSGRRVLAGQIAAAVDQPLLSVDEFQLLEGVPEADVPGAAVQAARAARLNSAILYWREAREPSPAARHALRAADVVYFAGRVAPWTEPAPQGRAFRSIELSVLPRASRIALWQALSDRPVPKAVADWLLLPGEISRLTGIESAGEEAIQQACRRPLDSLSLLMKMPLPFEPDELVLPAAINRAVQDFENQVRYRWEVYEDWGFKRLSRSGAGVIGLFAGPSGTGKTMTAQVLARKLGLELYRLDPAQVVNKYIGETEKRLKLVFDECDRAHFMLLIDECEAMFGQRFSSRDAHDRYANLEIDYLLQRLERFQGIAILSTNRKGDLDSAFVRRIRFVIDFLDPGPEERVRLWRKALPPSSPSGEVIVGNLDWDQLASISLTGAEIALSALNAAFLARADNQTICMPHILETVRRELAKKGESLRGMR